jgi:hypothetical protein
MGQIDSTTTITTKYVCPNTEEEVILQLEPSSLSHQELRSIYDDCDNGYELYYDFTCSKCGQRHEITVAKDSPFGCV